MSRGRWQCGVLVVTGSAVEVVAFFLGSLVLKIIGVLVIFSGSALLAYAEHLEAKRRRDEKDREERRAAGCRRFQRRAAARKERDRARAEWEKREPLLSVSFCTGDRCNPVIANYLDGSRRPTPYPIGPIPEDWSPWYGPRVEVRVGRD